MSKCERFPFVSVIVPVLNVPNRIRVCIESLLAQTYPKERHEIIVVDNGSTDDTREVIQRYAVTLLVEDRLRSSYAARNKGIVRARGEIIAFTDADCKPVPQWLENGVRTLVSKQAELAGGKITFEFSPQRTAAEVFDSISNMQIESNIQDQGVAKTANLFVAKHVFWSVGLFDDTLRSGGDVLWTRMATRSGFNLVYVPEAEVYHPARKLGALLRKQVRVGRGQIAIWVKQGVPAGRRTRRVLQAFRPPSLPTIRRRLEDRYPDLPRSTCLSVWLTGWAARLATNAGRLTAIAEKRSYHT